MRVKSIQFIMTKSRLRQHLMRVQLLCVGRLKSGPESVLATRYLDRAAAIGRTIGFSPIESRETGESRATRPDDRKREEAKAIQTLLPPRTAVLVFDENGTEMTSLSFAVELRRARDEGLVNAVCVIGGPDGLDENFLAEASCTVSFGRMTWPHQLVRVMAAEQLYRAMTILSAHPYHRA
ncbi:MAG TPA: 23S rRNA (pseudouridine(1915)-N(3))-methyltransferase RlmH [Methylocella sp.]|nr:23S rRNA (pseudouridine(1915)-N(3))-methyltransferase RlmH [Methylocella sp.]